MAMAALPGMLMIPGLGGCESEPQAQAPGPRTFQDIQLGEVKAPEQGMDVEFWVTDLSPAALGRALAPLNSTLIAGKTSEVWRSNGLRLYRVQADVGRRVAASLPMQGQVRREALPMLERWTPLATGRRWSQGLDIWLDQQNWGVGERESPLLVSMGKLSLTPGALRMLARNWVVASTVDPLATPSTPTTSTTSTTSTTPTTPTLPASMLVQLVPQHAESQRSGPSDLITGPSLSSPRDDGQVFDRLSIELVCERGEMILIVPVHPREELVEKSQTAQGDPAPDGAGPSTIPQVPLIEPTLTNPEQGPSPQASAGWPGDGESGRGSAATGPLLPDLLTLGEAMLTDATVGRGARRRVIIAITPRVPERFEPLGSTSLSGASSGTDARPGANVVR